MLDVPGWPGHAAGQHVDVRLTAEDGYQAQRSLLDRVGAGGPARSRSRSSGSTTARCRRTSPRSCARATRSSCAARSAATSSGGSQDGGPLLLVGGGSGVVPLMSMLRHRAARGQRRRRAAAALGEERRGHPVPRGARRARRGRGLVHADAPRGPTAGAASTAASTPTCSRRSARRRTSARTSSSAGRRPSSRPSRDLLLELGHDPAAIRTERFGPTGG